MRVFSQRWEFWREARLSSAAVAVLVTLRQTRITSMQVDASRNISFVFRVALDALEHRNVAEVHRVLEWLIALVAELTFVIR